jgi:hypothetical protein
LRKEVGYMRFWAVLFTLLAILVTPPLAAGQRRSNRTPDYSTWEGTYKFTENGGRAGGSSIIVEHKIRIYREGERLLADIDADGYQTAVALTCQTSSSGNRIELFYKNRRADDTSSQTMDRRNNFRDRYKERQLLLALEKSNLRKPTKILTYWYGYQPVEIPPVNGRVYFKKEP